MELLVKNGGKPGKTKPFHPWPYSDEREIELVNEVVKSGKWWRMTGNKVEQFEENFAKCHNVKHCLALTNGTHAIELALTTLGIGAGEEVIVPAISFISTASAVIYCNAMPVLVDIDPETFCMIPEAFEKAITPRTKAVIPVHIAGHGCQMDAICTIARKHGLKVIEDAAHGHGGEWKNKRLGSFGDISIFSFQNGKLMTCGEGGALVTNDTSLYESAYLYHGVGRPKGDRVYAHHVLGSNYRMSEFQGAILIAQLERLEKMNKNRDKNALILDKLLGNIEGIRPQGRNSDANLITHYMYMFYYDPKCFGGLSRKDFVDLLIAEGVPSYISFPVISDVLFFKQNNFNRRIKSYSYETEADLSNSRKIADSVVWLPHFTLLGDEQDMQEIAKTIKKIQNYSTSA
jgi:dTDP-4-amino-4,6-dideoxygalactose transaminase